MECSNNLLTLKFCQDSLKLMLDFAEDCVPPRSSSYRYSTLSNSLILV